MSLVIIEWEYEYDLLECPSLVAESIKEYQQQFDKWLYDKSNDHGYWVTESLHKTNPDESFGVDAFVDWLNRFVLHDKTEKAKVVGTYPVDERNEKGHAKLSKEYDYPHIFF